MSVCVCVARTCDGSPACPTSSRCDGTAPTSALRAREHCSRIASPSAQQRASVCGPPITHLACPLPPSGVRWLAHHGADESCWRWRVLAEWSLECQTCKSLCPSHTNPEQSASQIRGIGVMIFRQRLFCARTMLPLSSSFGAQCGALQHPTLPSKRLRPSPRPGLHDLRTAVTVPFMDYEHLLFPCCVRPNVSSLFELKYCKLQHLLLFCIKLSGNCN